MFENYFKHGYIFRVDRDLLLRLHLEDDPAPAKPNSFPTTSLTKTPRGDTAGHGRAGQGRAGARGAAGAGGASARIGSTCRAGGRRLSIPPLPSRSRSPDHASAECQAASRSRPGASPFPGRPGVPAAAALARPPPGQVSAGRRAPLVPRAPPPRGSGPAGEQGRRRGRSLPNSSARLLPAHGRFPFLISPPQSTPAASPGARPAERSRGAGSSQDFCLSCLCVCWVLFLLFFFLVFIWLSSLAGNGRGSGAWRKNKCGEREREPELNDRMRAA
ncbi:collagen alpha-1(I) chain-like [Manacus candei]|uniref:collagen alpha-1(I) chain-like n=1 Tax=Manacus candei TaxID=415023 RepID=UPI002225E26B|nr:collagen alpha-1(I) chain-like [Manacus candei]